MTKLTYEDIETLTRLSLLTTDKFLSTVQAQWDGYIDKATTLIARAFVDGIDPEHEDAVKDMLRVIIRCTALSKLIALAQTSPVIFDAFEPSDTELTMQLDALKAKTAEITAREQED
jgi:hypothetical protein